MASRRNLVPGWGHRKKTLHPKPSHYNKNVKVYPTRTQKQGEADQGHVIGALEPSLGARVQGFRGLGWFRGLGV